ncbi:MAG: BrxE family protein [Chloroflexi bacterium]|uniref:BrxE family protein n=1 Tax=Candidatus Flexifilum breve TaxID=3140694 RepID=UPI00313664B8|nr:BrxE family protein [Chloroflexota bacterium]
MFDLAWQDLSRLLQLQLLIARAGQRDSLQWWDDESLTSSGAYVVERVFVGAPQLTAQRLALRAAASRHAAALADFYTATHLFHLDEQRQTELALRGVRLPSEIDLQTPISDMTAFHDRLLSIVGTPPKFEPAGKVGLNNTQRIRLTVNASTILEKAVALAWAYTVSKVGHPVFPYFMERS